MISRGKIDKMNETKNLFLKYILINKSLARLIQKKRKDTNRTKARPKILI